MLKYCFISKGAMEVYILLSHSAKLGLIEEEWKCLKI